MQIGKKIFFDVITGHILVDTGQWENASRNKSIDEAIASYVILTELNRETFDVIELAYDDFAQDFSEGRLTGVDVATRELLFSYPDPNNPGEEIPYRPPITVEITEVKASIVQADSYSQSTSDDLQALTEYLIETGVI